MEIIELRSNMGGCWIGKFPIIFSAVIGQILCLTRLREIWYAQDRVRIRYGTNKISGKNKKSILVGVKRTIRSRKVMLII